MEGKVVIVTGAARGIGRAIARRFAQEGARVAVVDIREAEGAETVRLIQEAGGQAMFVRTDVSDSRQVQAMVDAVVKEWGTIDVLVNNAGICPFEEFLEMPETVWDQVLDVNLKGYFLCSQAVARVMIEQGVKGRIIAVSSISSEFGGSAQAYYCASKAGINLLIKSMAISLGPYGITCNKERQDDPTRNSSHQQLHRIPPTRARLVLSAGAAEQPRRQPGLRHGGVPRRHPGRCSHPRNRGGDHLHPRRQRGNHRRRGGDTVGTGDGCLHPAWPSAPDPGR